MNSRRPPADSAAATMSRGVKDSMGGLSGGVSRRALIGGGAAAFGCALQTHRAAAETFGAASTLQFDYPSGLRLVVKSARSSPLATIQVWIRAGGFLETPLNSGTAHVIEHLVFKGGEARAPGELDESVEQLGGVLEAQTDKDWTRFSCTVASRYVTRVLKSISESLTRPAFRPADWDAERSVIQAEIAQHRSEPASVVQEELYALAYANHPYRMDVRGQASGLSRLDLADVRTYYNAHYHGGNLTVIVCGDVDPAEMQREVGLAFGAEKPRTAPYKLALPAAEAPCATAKEKLLRRPGGTAYLGLAYAAPSVADRPDVYVMDVILTLLENRAIGRLPRALRGIPGFQASYQTLRQAGLFVLVAATPPDSARAVDALVRRELDLLKEPSLSDDEVGLAVRALHGNFVMENETLRDQAGTLGYYEAIDSWKFAMTYLERIREVRAGQVQAVARTYFQHERRVMVIADNPAARGNS